MNTSLSVIIYHASKNSSFSRSGDMVGPQKLNWSRDPDHALSGMVFYSLLGLL